MKTVTLAGLLILLVLPLHTSGQEKGKARERKVSAHLTFSVEEYDPTKPSKAVMKCVVKNNTPRGLHVPAGYDGGYIQLHAAGLNLIKNQPEKGDVRLVWVAPGQEEVIFELPLDDLFLRKAKPSWHWSWMRRSSPPLSPIHASGKSRFKEQASFVVSLDLGGYPLSSEAATLKVKSAAGK